MLTKRRIIAARMMYMTTVTVAIIAADTTLNVEDTTGFGTTGTGVIRDATNDLDVFTWTGKTSATLTGVAGTGGNAVLAHNAGALICSEDITTNLVAADAKTLPFDVKITPDIKMNKRNPVMATLSKLASITGSQMAKASFKVEIKGAGAAYSASVSPALAPFLRACGFAETIVTTGGAETATYKPTSTKSSIPALMIDSFEDGVIKRIYGARGNAKISGKAGEVCYIDFDFTGIWNGMLDAAMLTVAPETTIPPVFLSGNFSIASFAAVIKGFDIDIANTIAAREDPNNTTGYRETIITDRNPSGKFDPELTTVALHDWYGKWKAGTSGALNIGNIGSTQYNRYKITAPKVVYNQVADAEREGVAVADCSFELVKNSDAGDDELVIEFS